ncbi:MAG: hypothetical protein SFX73_32000 [Kofleriaceae bacterium]|nr:hypothetical protein [Kofleriaceae bacterium]
MTKLAALFAAFTLTFTVAACGGKKDDAPSASAKTAGGGKKVPTLTINEADWVEKDLSTVSPMIGITMKVPKDAKLEKNGNGGVDIKVADHYLITVSALAVSNLAEGIKWRKDLTIAHSGYQDGKVISEEPNGIITSAQMKTEANGTTYQPEVHFAYFVEKDGAIWSIADERPLEAFSTPGSAWSEALAKQVYGIVKSSAKAK